jgi:phosphate transport system substrate-binding protein
VRRIAVIALVMIGLSCSGRKSGIIIAGSTSIQPFIEKISEQFSLVYPGVKVAVQGGGSSAGIQAAMNKTCDIGMSSRKLKPEEKSLQTFLIALDGIAVIVNRDNLVRDLTMDQIRRIFTGEISNWRMLGGPDKKIYPVTREEGSGTRSAFEEMVMHQSAISDACLVQDSNGALRETVANSPEAIGYISAGLIDVRVRAVALDSILPTYDNIIADRYKIVRPFLLLTRDEPSGPTRDFINYVLSIDGQATLKKVGLIPVMDLKKEPKDER